jgi:transposase
VDRLGSPQTALRADGGAARLRWPAPRNDRLDGRAGAPAFLWGASQKGGAAGQAIGRSRGGLSTKIVAVACDEDGVIAVDLAEGQCHDAPLALPVLAEARATLGRIDEVLADKGFDSDAIRQTCLEVHDALPVIPNKVNRKDPWPWCDAMIKTYKERNRVERVFGKAKQFRRFATRYEKLKDVYLGLVRLIFGFIHVKRLAQSVNTA